MLSVIIPARNAADLIPEQLQGLATQAFSGDWEVIVADNGSTDGTREVAGRWKGRVSELSIVDASAVPGASFARNVGARRARGNTLLFCDADDVVAPGWLAAMAEASTKFDCWGGRLDEETLNDARQLAWRGRRLQTGLTPGFLPHPQSANCGVTAAAFAAVGGFDPAYVGGGEDVEFFWRLQLAGFQLGFVPDAVVQYRHRGGLRDLARQQYRYGQSSVWLYRDFRAYGMRPGTLREALKIWAWLAIHSPKAVTSDGFRGRWLHLLARRAGRVSASLQLGLFAP